MSSLSSFPTMASFLPRRMHLLTHHFVLSTMFKISLLLSSVAASAQGQWAGDLWLENCRSNVFHSTTVFIDENNKIKKIIPNLAYQKDFSMLCHKTQFSEPLWHNGALYTITEGTMEKNWIFAKWQDGRWHFLGHYKMDYAETHPEYLDDDDFEKHWKQYHQQYNQDMKAIPCGNGRFIAIFWNKNGGIDSKSKSKATPFYRMSISPQQEFTIDKAIDHGQDPLRMASPDYFNLAHDSSIIMTERHATLLSQETGLYWVFSLKDASLVKAGNIFKETAKMITPEMVAKGGFANSPILCANPERMGTVLISAQDERFFAAETRNFSEEYSELLSKNNPHMPDDEILEKLQYPLQKEFANRSPNIVWYRIYPETGEVERLKVPPPGGSRSRNGMNDDWRPMPDGWVSHYIYYDTEMALEEEVKKQIMDRIADFPHNIQKYLLESLFREGIEKLRRTGIKNVSFITFMSDLKKLLKASIKAYKLKPEAETFFNESFNAYENEFKAHEKQMKKEFEEFQNREVKNSYAK